VAAWKWDTGEGDVCGICRNEFEACCPGCAFPGDDCPPLWGSCNHAFHLHCIVKWLEAQADKGARECPLCRRPWEER
jgi:anaphase-promoting complex subunit 11